VEPGNRIGVDSATEFRRSAKTSGEDADVFPACVAYCRLSVVSATSVSAEEQSPQAIKVSASDKAACMPDALRLCRDAIPNVQNVLLCFGQNRDKISNRCRVVLAGYGLQ
jgi:hypothetical protein